MEYIQYTMDSRIPVILDTDVLVVGGGPGGCSAATMAARQGVKVALAEKYGCLGGMAVVGEVSPFMPNHVHAQTLDRPFFVEWCRQMYSYQSPQKQRQAPFDPAIKDRYVSKTAAMLALEDLTLAAGVHLLFHHDLVDVVMSGKKISAVIFHSKAGFVAVKAKIFIDATGDGDLAVLAGAPFEIGNDQGFCQPMTTCFKLSGVDTTRMPDRSTINDLYRQAQQNGEITCQRENVLWFKTPEPGVIHFNTTRIIKKSGVNGMELSAAEIEGRQQIRQFVQFFRAHIPGFENAELASIAVQVGVRESRRILGEIYQTVADFKNAAKYDDGIARANYVIDIHNPTGSGTTIETMPADDWYEIRFGTLIPRNIDNILMGCRAISIDHQLHSSARIMPVVCSIGQAAGIAATCCVQNCTLPRQLDGRQLRHKLIELGANL